MESKYIGFIRNDNSHGPFEIIDDLGTHNKTHKVKIRFIEKNIFDFNTELEVQLTNALYNNIRDPYKATSYDGKACKGIISVYKNGKNTDEYNLWSAIIKM